jgi:hypothetical protein
MNVLVFAPFAVTEYHFATDLEIAQRHLDHGDRVRLAVCNADLMTCEANAEHDLGRCVRCVGHRIEGMSRLSPRTETVPFLRLSATDREELRNINIDGMTLDDLRKFYVDNFDAGWAVRSSLISALGTSEFDPEAHKPRILAALRSAVAVYRSIQKLLVDLEIERLYIYNGRFATMRAALRAAQSKGVDCFIHERGSTFEKYSLFENHLPHELDYYQDLIRRAWDAADPDFREAVGAGFYADRITGSLGSWVSFSVKQQGGLLPEGWRDDVRNIALFSSSTDDIDALDDAMMGGAYSDQYDALDRIFASVPPGTGVHFYLRIHPRTQTLPEPHARRFEKLRLPHVTVIPAASPISTYALMRRASRVVSFGSTTGIEAVHWGIPSILGMRAFFDRLGSTYNPKTHEEMVQLISAPTLPTNDRLGALMYGYWQKTFGIPFRFFHPLGLFGGSFKDSPIKPHLAFRTAGWLLERAFGRDTRSRLHRELVERRMLAP